MPEATVGEVDADLPRRIDVVDGLAPLGHEVDQEVEPLLAPHRQGGGDVVGEFRPCLDLVMRDGRRIAGRGKEGHGGDFTFNERSELERMVPLAAVCLTTEVGGSQRARSWRRES